MKFIQTPVLPKDKVYWEERGQVVEGIVDSITFYRDREPAIWILSTNTPKPLKYNIGPMQIGRIIFLKEE